MKLRPQQWHRHAGGQHWPDHAQHAQCAHQTGADSLAQRESAMKLRLQQWHRRADQHWPDPAQHPECLNPKLRLTRSPSGSQRRSSTCGWRRRAGGRHWSNPAPPPPIKNCIARTARVSDDAAVTAAALTCRWSTKARPCTKEWLAREEDRDSDDVAATQLHRLSVADIGPMLHGTFGASAKGTRKGRALERDRIFDSLDAVGEFGHPSNRPL